MERDTHPELEEVVAEAAVGMPPDKVRYRRDRCVRTDPNVIAAAERESGARITSAAPSLARLGPRKPDAHAQEPTAGGLRIIIRRKRHVPRRDCGAALTLRPRDALRPQEQMRTHSPTQPDVAGVRTFATESAAAAARDPVTAVTHSETDPESLASLWMLRRRNRNTQHQQRHDHYTAARDVPHWVPPEEERGPIFEIAELIAMPGYVQTQCDCRSALSSRC